MRYAFVFLMCFSCIEPYEPTTQEFEDILVVEALLTDESKTQKVTLTRSYAFEEEIPKAKQGADVRISDNLGNEFYFKEATPGIYESNVSFKAEKEVQYTLGITLASGESFTSTPEQLQETVSIDSLYAERINNDFGNNGMAIFLNSSNSMGSSKYFRYEYEETFKIVAPYWTPDDYKIVGNSQVTEVDEVFASNEFESVILSPKDEEERVCFGTNLSTKIILGSTENLNENKLVNFQVHFVDSNNYILSHRYSILVKQFVISHEAYKYYEILRDISSSENLFAENQTGFFVGNVRSMNNPDKKVIGLFDVSSVSTKRIFFNYSDYYPNERLPPYINNCRAQNSETLMEQVRLDLVHYIEPNETDNPPLNSIPRECGDCTALGSNVRPSFWQD